MFRCIEDLIADWKKGCNRRVANYIHLHPFQLFLEKSSDTEDDEDLFIIIVDDEGDLSTMMDGWMDGWANKTTVEHLPRITILDDHITINNDDNSRIIQMSTKSQKVNPTRYLWTKRQTKEQASERLSKLPGNGSYCEVISQVAN